MRYSSSPASSRSVSAVYDGPPRSISTRLGSRPATSATAAATIAKRSSAAVIRRPALFCHGSLATTSNTVSSARASRTFSAATMCPMWTGSNVPPNTPTRTRWLSGAGEFGDDGGEVDHRIVLDDDVAVAKLLAPLLKRLADLLDGADQSEGGLGRLLRRQA